MKIRKILEYLLIIQKVSNKNRTPKLGRGYQTAIRFNPYNPLSYIALFLIIVVGILMFGFVGFWKETDMINHFRWN